MKHKSKNIIAVERGTNILQSAIKGITKFIHSGPLKNYIAYAERRMH